MTAKQVVLGETVDRHCPECGCPECGAFLHHPVWGGVLPGAPIVYGSCSHCGAFLVHAKDRFRVATVADIRTIPAVVRIGVQHMQRNRGLHKIGHADANARHSEPEAI